jgi:hypothetical protein
VLERRLGLKVQHLQSAQPLHLARKLVGGLYRLAHGPVRPVALMGDGSGLGERGERTIHVVDEQRQPALLPPQPTSGATAG